MNKKSIKYSVILMVIAFLMVILTGCGSSSSSYDSINGNYFGSINKGDSTIIEGALSENNSTTQGSSSSNKTVSTNRKIIEEYDFRVETKEFDVLLEKINKEVKNLGGYIEKSSIDNDDHYRSADYTIRITQNNSLDFNNFISESSNVVHSETNTKDVTLTYVDIESRIKSYKTEQAKLEELMENATNLDDILSIQDRLTEVIYEIEAYESQLRTYDNLIDYTTINLYVVEVEKETVTEELSIWEEIGNNLQEGFSNVGDFMVNLFIFAISSIPYLLLFGLPVLITFFLVLMIKRIKNRKKGNNLPHRK